MKTKTILTNGIIIVSLVAIVCTAYWAYIHQILTTLKH